MAQDASPWPTVTFIGILCGITFGLVLYSILRRERDGVGGAAALPDLDLSGLGALPVVSSVPRVGKSRPSAARTMTISASKPSMILRAVGGDWRVSVRVLNPHSSFAAFTIGQDVDSTVVVPAGSSQDLWLPKGQYLYAKGSEANVCVSASGGQV